MAQQMRCKVFCSGETVEMYFYSSPITVGASRKHKIEKRDKSICNSDDKRLDNMFRARSKIRRLIWSNQTKFTKFVTLTYSETVLDLSKVRRDVTTFVQAMRRLGYDMKYLYVLENQRHRGQIEGNAGSIHVHMLIFLDDFIVLEDLRKCWSHGFVGIEAIDDVKNLGAYVCKYITKDNIMDFGSHCYACSLNLKKPVEEKFYTFGFSDSVLDFQPEDVLSELNITYDANTTFEFFDSDGVLKEQNVRYLQGKWRSCNVILQRGQIDE